MSQKSSTALKYNGNAQKMKFLYGIHATENPRVQDSGRNNLNRKVLWWVGWDVGGHSCGLSHVGGFGGAWCGFFATAFMVNFNEDIAEMSSTIFGSSSAPLWHAHIGLGPFDHSLSSGANHQA